MAERIEHGIRILTIREHIRAGLLGTRVVPEEERRVLVDRGELRMFEIADTKGPLERERSRARERTDGGSFLPDDCDFARALLGGLAQGLGVLFRLAPGWGAPTRKTAH